MRRLGVGGVALALGLVAVVACSEDETKPSSRDSGTTGDGAAGGAGLPGTGGTAGADASAGSSGTDASAGSGGTDASAGSGGTDASAGSGGTAGAGGADAGLVCRSMRERGMTDGGVEAAAGASGAAGGGGAGGATYQWHDWANNQCRDCQEILLDCSNFEGGSYFDPVTQIVTLELQPGLAEIVSAQVTYLRFTYDDGDGGILSDTLNGTSDMKVEKNLLTLDLSGQLPAQVIQIDGIAVSLIEACSPESLYVPLMAEAADGGARLPIYCEY
ncbi:MAG: hypothetical protein OZ921_16830 [Sorangiineae bacterium]|nr:hypothetical protein [Polyangiaceae bacterium]MEB2324180.1 hypothetical protein [Sorangiineae bacterium]